MRQPIGNVALPRQYMYRRVVQAKLFIDKHYAESIDLSQIADEALFSKFHFIRLFKLAYGKTPLSYLTQVRIERARQLLAGGDSVASVCFSVGFDSVTSFTALFKRNVGISPSVYREWEKQRRNSYAENPLRGVPNCFAETYGWKKSNFR
jgi:AraC-like DNA-binding protein